MLGVRERDRNGGENVERERGEIMGGGYGRLWTDATCPYHLDDEGTQVQAISTSAGGQYCVSLVRWWRVTMEQGLRQASKLEPDGDLLEDLNRVVIRDLGGLQRGDDYAINIPCRHAFVCPPNRISKPTT
ncbi:hypothetical protein TIFTF001_010134 [Ficus carica]|uniref:Uncharacterized protein n=1 Tax=Ficus carica TaxID=3494 RepID=A0AA87ZWJ3_FICCA|nr:hypothetical protein TIFTF001_010134 [Ficus carica]